MAPFFCVSEERRHAAGRTDARLRLSEHIVKILPLRWEAQVVTEIMACVAVAPVPVVAFKKLQ